MKGNGVSKATFYNRVLPRLKRVGMVKVERDTLVNVESKRKFRPMRISLSKTFGNYFMKIGDSWLAIVDDARSKMEKKDRILAKYREGDLRKRLDLYLEYRDLRRDFNEIDREDTKIGSVPLFEPVITSAYSFMEFFIRTFLGLLKRSVTSLISSGKEIDIE